MFSRSVALTGRSVSVSAATLLRSTGPSPDVPLTMVAYPTERSRPGGTPSDMGAKKVCGGRVGAVAAPTVSTKKMTCT
eukprot:5095725-Prymnesium_polylepis.1